MRLYVVEVYFEIRAHFVLTYLIFSGYQCDSLQVVQLMMYQLHYLLSGGIKGLNGAQIFEIIISVRLAAGLIYSK